LRILLFISPSNKKKINRCPQAVGSGRSRELNGIYVQRAVIVSSFGLVLYVLFLN
jgi:hypothetical protein